MCTLSIKYNNISTQYCGRQLIAFKHTQTGDFVAEVIFLKHESKRLARTRFTSVLPNLPYSSDCLHSINPYGYYSYPLIFLKTSYPTFRFFIPLSLSMQVSKEHSNTERVKRTCVFYALNVSYFRFHFLLNPLLRYTI